MTVPRSRGVSLIPSFLPLLLPPARMQVRSREEMRKFHGTSLPTELGGNSPYTFALSDVMLPMMKVTLLTA